MYIIYMCRCIYIYNMFHILYYGLVCRENFVVDEVCRIVKKIENY